MQDDLKNKFEEFNEQVLKNTAVTFSLEGFSKDLNNYVQKKITFNTRMMKHLTLLVNSIIQSDSKAIKNSLLREDSLPVTTLKHIYEESQVTNGLLNYIIQKNIENESSLVNETSSSTKKSHKPKNSPGSSKI